ncbi:hypothetical protein [Cellulomonas cellasea]|uniref:RAMA domain-containing protein n=1 Tax=Cellulomonas cellasea TaxID=43670 RepID=A0A7W4UJH0_9CELL|nr:hypothetical protein [Cellulomonas cellasea]MBB2924648.1 hypothetical protein [Cellulomonas cellasea]
MPIFELDEGRPLLVQPMQPASSTFAPDTSALVADHLTALLGEQLFQVRVRHEDDEAPHLLALDAGGQPVVVDVVHLLDAEALVRALGFAGQAARLTRSDLARAYQGGREAFDADLAVFRDRSPLTAQHAPRTGSRLVLVCSEVDDDVSDALAFLRQPGRQVEVLQMGVVQGGDGRRYVDVSPVQLGPHRTPRPVEPAAMIVPAPVPAPLTVTGASAHESVSARVAAAERPRPEPVPAPRPSADEWDARDAVRDTGAAAAVGGADDGRDLRVDDGDGRRDRGTDGSLDAPWDDAVPGAGRPAPVAREVDAPAWGGPPRAAGTGRAADPAPAADAVPAPLPVPDAAPGSAPLRVPAGDAASAPFAAPAGDAGSASFPVPGAAPVSAPLPAPAAPAAVPAARPALAAPADVEMTMRMAPVPLDDDDVPPEPPTRSGGFAPRPEEQRAAEERAAARRRADESTTTDLPRDPAVHAAELRAADEALARARAFDAARMRPARREPSPLTAPIFLPDRVTAPAPVGRSAAGSEGGAAAVEATSAAWASPSTPASGPTPLRVPTATATGTTATGTTATGTTATGTTPAGSTPAPIPTPEPYRPTFLTDERRVPTPPNGALATSHRTAAPADERPARPAAAPAPDGHARALVPDDDLPLRDRSPRTDVPPTPPTGSLRPASLTGASGLLSPDPALAALAKGRGAVATLVWFRERRGQRLVATLRGDGLIELPDGRVHADPDLAAAEAANAEGAVDGWGSWRVGDGGPTLAEAAGTR